MKILLYTFCLLIAGSSLAQQLPQYTQAALNRSLYNPAFVGDEQQMIATAGGRWQMIGFGNEPRTAFLGLEKGIAVKKKPVYNPAFRISREIPDENNFQKRKFSHGWGAQLIADNFGAFRSFQLAGLYGAHYQVNPDLKVSGGVRLSYNNNSFDAGKAQVLNPLNPTEEYGGGDAEYDAYTDGGRNTNFIHLGAGFNVQYQKFFIGASANQLTKDAIRFGSTGVNFDPTMHFFVMTGYTFDINSEVTLRTFATIKKMRPAPTSFELTAIAGFGESLFAGLNYHHQSSLGFIVGFHVSRNFRVGYAFDVPTTPLNQFSFGGHELVLNYRF
jgi:type IX secretion system PorP/SprF family membrane protein